MRALAVAAAAAGVLWIAGTPVAAQQPGNPLTLDEALAVARVQNPSVRQATNQLALNEPERWNFLFGELMPTVQANLFSTGYSGNVQRRATDNFGNPIESPTADWVYFSNTRQDLTLSWQVNGPSIFNAIARRDNTLEGRDAGVDAARWTLRGQIHRQFFDAQEQAALLEVEEALLEGRQVDFESARRRFEVAGISRVEVLNAEVQVQQQQIAIEQQRSAREQALLSLRQTLGGDEVPGIAPEPLPIFDPTVLDAEELVRTALANNPGLRSAQAGVADARIGVRESDESWWPTLSVSYRLSRNAQDRETAALLDFGYDEIDIGQNFGVSLSFNALNNFFGMRQQQASARVQLANQEITLDEQQLQIDADVRSNLVALQNSWRTLELADRSAAIARQATALAREEYALGLQTFEELQSTVEQEATARRQALTSRYAFVDALIALEESVGVPVRPLGVPQSGPVAN
jgi:outer membrane protein TolC